MKKLKCVFASIALLLIFTASCKKGTVQPLVPLKSEDYINVSYGTNARNRLDIYLPPERDQNTPVILLVHGGSWFEGDKSVFTDLAKYWRDKGYATATMNYRLTNSAENNIHPAQVNDIGKAIEFISSKSVNWHISPDKFALQGASAGAHLSLLYTYKYNTDNKVKAVISMAGPADLTMVQLGSPRQAQVIQWLIGTTIQADPLAYAQASPVTHISAASKPTLIFHGKLDAVVPYQQSADLVARLNQLGVNSKLVLYEDTGHEVLNLNHTVSFLADSESWFKLYLK
ncbi:MAG: alpha/beta fold hydrolase [Daejeonella sp.]